MRSLSGADVLIAGGRILDGTGAPPFAGSIAVRGDRVTILDPDDAVDGRVGQRIEAAGRIVAPGFIDLHSHSALQLLADGRGEAKVRQGITTEVIGVDGLSYAPFTSRRDLEAFVEMNAGLEGRPKIDYSWSSVDSYLARFDRTTAHNVAYVVGNSVLRIAALGWSDGPAGPGAVQEQRAVLREAMAEGAFGISSGLDYPPGSYATTEELAKVAAEAGLQGGFYHTHVRYQLGDRYLDPIREAIEIGRLGDVPVHVTHLYHRESHPGGPEPILELIDDARAAGMDVTFDTYPSEWGNTKLLIQLPQWIQDGGPQPLKARLADASARAKVRREFAQRGTLYSNAAGWADVRLGAFKNPQNLRWENHTLAAVMQETGRDAVDCIADLLLSENLGVSTLTHGPWAATLHHFIRHPAGMVGSDSTFQGENLSPRSYGSFPRILGQFVRDEALLSLEEAVRKMTSAAAARLGLRERGVLRDDAVADVVVFDPAVVRANATADDPRRYPDGIDHVIVGGVPVVADGLMTGAMPGRALRRGRDS